VRALVATADTATPVALLTVPEPRPRADEARVAVEAVSLNRGECRRLLTADSGWVPGWDVAGVVVDAAADGSGPPEGRRVVGLVDQGAWAERVAVRTDRLAVLPDGLSAVAAATLPVAGLTALLCLARGGQLLGKRVAVTGATGGVGVFALQLAALTGAHTTAVVSGPDRTTGLPEQGVDEVEVGLDRGDGRFDLILESVGGPLLAAALTRIAPGGRIVTYGNSSGQPTTIDIAAFYPRHDAALTAFRLFEDLDAHGGGSRHLDTLATLLDAGLLDVPIDVERPWGEGAKVVRALLDRRVAGKAVLTVT
jgi:NADPH:quinone reductase-like Zn-dependent oxidoreductase